MFDAVQGLGEFLFLFVVACPYLMQCRDLQIFVPVCGCLPVFDAVQGLNDFLSQIVITCLVHLDAVIGLSDFCVHVWDCWWPVVYGTDGWLWATLKQSVTGDTTCGHLFRFCACDNLIIVRAVLALVVDCYSEEYRLIRVGECEVAHSLLSGPEWQILAWRLMTRIEWWLAQW